MTADIANKLAKQLAALDASLMITVSRRTGKENEAILREALNDKEHCFFWDGTGENPYFAMLALADHIIVTGDSASMLSEACTTGKPVYMIPLEPKGDKPIRRIDKLHAKLQDLGCLKKFDGKLESWDYTPLKDAAAVAKEIKKRIKDK